MDTTIKFGDLIRHTFQYQERYDLNIWEVEGYYGGEFLIVKNLFTKGANTFHLPLCEKVLVEKTVYKERDVIVYHGRLYKVQKHLIFKTGAVAIAATPYPDGHELEYLTESRPATDDDIAKYITNRVAGTAHPEIIDRSVYRNSYNYP